MKDFYFKSIINLSNVSEFSIFFIGEGKLIRSTKITEIIKITNSLKIDVINPLSLPLNESVSSGKIKIDLTAKGGIVLSILDKLSIPISFLGVGESFDDLSLFDLDNYLDKMV